MAVLLFRLIVRVVPVAWDGAIARALVAIVPFFNPALRRRLRDHLRLIYGAEKSFAEREALAERVLRHLCVGITEFVRMPTLTPDDVRRRVEIRGKQHLHRARERGKGVILATGHYGNFEMMAACCGAFGLSLVAIARPRDDETTEQFIAATRSQHSVTVVGKRNWRTVLRELRRNQLAGIIADQAALTGGVMADFLGHPAATAVGPLVLSRWSGAPILPCFVTRDANQRFAVTIHPPLELDWTDDEQADFERGCKLLNDVISAQIRSRPHEWLWFHRRWKKPLATRQSAPRLEKSVEAAAGE